MKMSAEKAKRILWRTGRNFLSALPVTRNLLFPSDKLAIRFGRGDAEYSWSVFLPHAERLFEAGFHGASRFLEAVSYTHLTLPTILRV